MVPVVVDSSLQWPPRGNIAAFQSDFVKIDNLRVDAAGEEIDTVDLLAKVQQACQSQVGHRFHLPTKNRTF